jgi:hypothetical protein
MSGRRTKALRREFKRIHGRAPETTAYREKTVSGLMKIVRRMRDAVTGAPKTETTIKRRPVVLLTESHSEFRRFKRARRAA